MLIPERGAKAPESCDNLVQYQQETMGAAQFAQALQITDWGQIYSAGSNDRLNDNSRNLVAAMGVDDALQILCQMCALFRLASAKTLSGRWVFRICATFGYSWPNWPLFKPILATDKPPKLIP